ncbi:16S rRNA (guanine(527)-N(7))-methyltransferase RsmG [Endozoicomonas sp.]|uniref:16S rRNA (guanine(527)-N(7))-methyltransferase RsmG n=1 Tax=Endozoicomonas sp. TaxID=1892382 RepID=UPI0028873E84|nr:16S rRNA (guanine(527)-N(7))-methyltransferase RsmG [Endozoicomonas sp.]
MADGSTTIHTAIIQGAKALAIELSGQQADLLTRYVLLLAKWNKAYNLTAVRDPEEMVSRHIIDSLSIVPHVTGDSVLDVGSGPGLPGIVLAIMYPGKKFTTLDSNGKKTRFMLQAKMDLQLANLDVANARVESFKAQVPFDAITSRAFSSLVNMVDGTKHFYKAAGREVPEGLPGSHPALLSCSDMLVPINIMGSLPAKSYQDFCSMKPGSTLA